MLTLIYEWYSALFDPAARSKRRVEAMQKQMEVIWSNCNDALVLSFNSPDSHSGGSRGDFMIRVSPSFNTGSDRSIHLTYG